MIELKQYTGSVITPTDDALLYDFLLSEQSGIFEGCEVTHLGANQLQVSAGRGAIRGRVFVIESETILAELSQTGTLQGRLLVRIDLDNAESPIVLTTQAENILPALIQEDINRGGSIFEMSLATYTAEATQVSDLKNVATPILFLSNNLYSITLSSSGWALSSIDEVSLNGMYIQQIIGVTFTVGQKVDIAIPPSMMNSIPAGITTANVNGTVYAVTEFPPDMEVAAQITVTNVTEGAIA